MSNQTFITLNNGIKIPQFGLGVFCIEGEENTEKAVINALKIGYRHIDTAHGYFNERGVGAGVNKSGIPRKDIFVTSKLWPNEYGENKTYQAVEKMLKRFNLDYLDLILLHHPLGDFIGAWKDLEKLNKEGKVKSIGISNFDRDWEGLDKLLKTAKIKPAVCQVECHPYYTQQKLRSVLKPYNIAIECSFPIKHGDKQLINEPVFTKLAKKYNKTNVQIILRWHIQCGNIIFPKSSNPVHIKENFEIFDFELTPEEMEEIKKIENGNKIFKADRAGYQKMIDSFNQRILNYD